MASRDLRVTLIGEDRTGKAFNSAAANADGFGGKLKGVGGIVAKAFGAAAVAGVAGFGAALFQGVKDAASYEQITNQLAQTLKSTGNAAGTSIDQLKQYAGELESISGVDEELILSSQNVLATFTNLKNTVGAGNDIFNQASEAALNLSTTMGGDLQGASVMVGKALNDPIAGITALSRAGVQLTEAQKEQIRTMVASGDTMGAQKLILGELTTQFGGAAAAAGEGLTGSLARAQDAFSDVFREIGTKLLPTIAQAAEWFAAKLPSALDKAGAAFTRISAIVSSVTKFYREHQTVVAAVAAAVVVALGAMAVAATMAAARSVVAWFTVATSATAGGAASTKSAAQVAVGWAVMGAQSMLHAAKVAAAWLVAMGPVGWAIAAVIGVTAVIVANWDKVRGATVAAWNAVSGAVSGAWASIKGAVSAGAAAVIGIVTFMPRQILGALGNLGGLLKDAGRQVIQGFIDGITGAFRRVKETLSSLTSMLPDWKGPARKDARILYGSGKLVMGGLERGLRSEFGSIRRTMGDATDLLGVGVGGAGYINGRLASTAAPVGGRTVQMTNHITVADGADVDRLVRQLEFQVEAGSL